MKKTDLSRYDNSWYSPGASKLVIVLWMITSVLLVRNPLMISMKFKKWILRCFGARIGQGVWIKQGVQIKYPWRLTIGNNCWIGENTWIENLADVTLGNNCVLSQGSMLLCGNHNYKKETFDLMTEEIKLEDGVWISARSVVCGGVTCRSHSVLSVNSVATEELAPYSVYSGTPAVKIRERVII